MICVLATQGMAEHVECHKDPAVAKEQLDLSKLRYVIILSFLKGSQDTANALLCNSGVLA